MMIKIKCFYDVFKSNDLFRNFVFLDDKNEIIDTSGNIYEYISITLESDLYYREIINKHFEIIKNIEANPNEIFDDGGGQHFCLEFHHDKVIFYHNEFDEEEGFPVLSCSLKMFKTALIAWSAFLQLPRSIHTVLETVIEEE